MACIKCCRLAKLDLSNVEYMPMGNAKGTTLITYNREIHNHKRLKVLPAVKEYRF